MADSRGADTQSANGDGRWRPVHERLVRLARDKAAYDHEEGRWLLEGRRLEVHRQLGFGSYFEYLERLFGYSGREAAERLRVAEALSGLPRMEEALRTGTLCWSAARELNRVATADTEEAWLEAAEGQTVRQVEQMVSGHRPGDRPEDPADEQARSHVLRFEVEADTFAAVREAKAALVRQMGHAVSDDELLLSLARAVLGGPGDEGRASYQVAVSVCDRCGRAGMDAGGETVTRVWLRQTRRQVCSRAAPRTAVRSASRDYSHGAVGPQVVEMAGCDAQHIGRVDAHVGPGDTHVGPGDTHLGSGDTHVGSGDTHVGPVRATQTISPATRRAVLRRHGGTCAVPGCRNHAFLDLHHTVARADGGDHDPDKLCPLCACHHRATHTGRLIVRGTWSSGFRFEHAHGAPYGRMPEAAGAPVFTQVQGALRSMGFKDREARGLVDAVRARTHVGTDAASLLREALRAAPVTCLRERPADYRRAA